MSDQDQIPGTSRDHEPSGNGAVRGEAADRFHAAEYAAKGWPSIDPRSPAYCYQPCENGLHVCGLHPDENNFLTIDNFPTAEAESARALFNQARMECCSEKGEPYDFVVDLQQDDDCCEDFTMNRQMLWRLEQLHALGLPANPAIPAPSDGGEAVMPLTAQAET